MAKGFTQYFNRNALIGVIVTSAILGFYNGNILLFYILSLLLIIVINYKWNIIDISKINNALVNITLTVLVIFGITILAEIWLQVYPHRFTGIDPVDTVGEFSDYTSRGYLTEDIFKKRSDTVRILGLGDSFSVYLWDKGKNYNNLLQDEI